MTHSTGSPASGNSPPIKVIVMSISHNSNQQQYSDELKRNTAPLGFWLIGIIALLWNCAGLAMFILQVSLSPEMIAQMPTEQQSLYRDIPTWVMIFFGLATISGTLASVLLLARRKWALALFVISTIAVIAQNIYNWFVVEAVSIIGVQVIIMPLLIIGINLFLIWFSRYSIQQKRLT